MTTLIDTKNHPAVKALTAHQERLGLSNGRIAKRYLRCSDATWSTLKSGTYPSENVGPWIEKIETALRVIEDESFDSEGSDELLEFTDSRAAITAIRRCAAEPRNRLVPFLADTGGGKTKLALKLRSLLKNTVVIVEATETWRDNYYAAVLAICEALEITDDVSTARKAESALIGTLVLSPRILAIDEAHYAGKEALNLIKLILNKTMCRVLMLAMPQLWDRMMKKSWEETQQLRNRTFAKIVLKQVSADDTRTFITAKMAGYDGLKGEGKDAEKQAVAACREAANRFGLFNTLQTICNEVNFETGGKAASLEHVVAAIIRVEALRS